ncbi:MULTISPECIES: DUF3110 domain-containing protein [Arthrospira]|jgi:hypothetical protein|uniref:DUF3110 domain-containing protein n=1 Tax=Limnospira platensis NIES-46 TaxID=1236695 RepID=A0A5M3T9P5_LIMPL|nr:DUF3110 domain-containing protein [Arthrospira platensis]AMW28787.1 hypothetical protein AP285_13265 [Arthrospira platensis YZ]KDR56267.1 hypothetical protein APPUASWS_017815 [Arthrospira platensis str. Paraca]MBD2713326.1 DUF3110 domain-containing protein [Arthrospira platensis FACHB-835]MDF2210344.1 DUF3110 domain-containing protein [Arthrospira platensis NCB002]MDT9181781.1 DUF3110 domain-containing protein [Limnospira sp. PMC 289.06]MDT9293957.1 DUF3110 domain-containing protein [Arthr
MKVYVLLFNAGTDNEGIHTIQMGDRNKVLMFEEEDDALRFGGLLEAQDFPSPCIEAIDDDEIKEFCRSVDYDWELIPSGALAIPPENNVEEFEWEKQGKTQDERDSEESSEFPSDELDSIRRRLEGLL